MCSFSVFRISFSLLTTIASQMVDMLEATLHFITSYHTLRELILQDLGRRIMTGKSSLPSVLHSMKPKDQQGRVQCQQSQCGHGWSSIVQNMLYVPTCWTIVTPASNTIRKKRKQATKRRLHESGSATSSEIEAVETEIEDLDRNLSSHKTEASNARAF